MSVSATIRQSLLNGGVWWNSLVPERFPGYGRKTLGNVIAQMRCEGYVFEMVKLDPDNRWSESSYKLTDYRPTEDQIAKGKAEWKIRQAPKAKPKAKPKPIASNLPDPATLPPPPPRAKAMPVAKVIADDRLDTYPTFGSSLKVVLLSEGEDGTITIGLRNGKGTYVAELVGLVGAPNSQ